MIAALLPCPFCGHERPEFERMGDRRQSCIVICGNCGARHESGDEGARNGSSWNQRAASGQDGLRATLETALARIEDMLADDDGQAFKEARKFLPVGRAALAAQPGAERDRESFQAGYEAAQADAQICELPPFGWSCTRTRGHEGPCAAVESPDDARLVADGMKRLREAKPAQQDAVDAGMYRKKPVVIEAFQMTRERRQDNKEWPEWLNRGWNMTWPEPGAVSCEDFPTSDGTDRLVIATLEGVHTVSFGDWIIKGVKGEIYPCKPDIFEATYERAAISAKKGGAV